jgi:hypothetical protein
VVTDSRDIEQPSARQESSPHLLLATFAATIFLSAALLFSVQPLFAKMVLPKLGGSPAVWSVAMVFFQATLLAGYAYAHVLVRRAGLRKALAIHALVMAGALLVLRTDRAAVVRAGAIGGLFGLLCGGFFFTLIENFRVYGSPVTAFKESGAMGNRNETAGQAAISVVRFVISLFDLGQITRVTWPGRGGWGATFGLPFIWALAVLFRYRTRVAVRRAVSIAAIYMLVFAVIYTDADIAHRLILGPGLLLILVAISIIDDDDQVSRVLQASLYAVIVLSALQIARSASLYLRS